MRANVKTGGALPVSLIFGVYLDCSVTNDSNKSIQASKEGNLELINYIEKHIKTGTNPIFAQVATISKANTPQIRTMLLAEVTVKNEIIFYSNTESKKWENLTTNQEISICLYNHFDLTQVIIKGIASLRSLKNYPQFAQQRWVMLSPDVQKIYFPDRAETNFAPENFGIISVNPKFWEFLQVQTPYYKSEKIIFEKVGSNWVQSRADVSS